MVWLYNNIFYFFVKKEAHFCVCVCVHMYVCLDLYTYVNTYNCDCLIGWLLVSSVMNFMFFCLFYRDTKDVDFDADRFMKDMESVLRGQGFEDTGNDVDHGESSSSDMDFGNLLD